MAEDRSVQQMQAAGARILQTSPGLADKLLTSSKPKIPAGFKDGHDKDSAIADLQRQLAAEQEKNRNLEDQYKYRVASFVKREAQTKSKIESLERRLNDSDEVDEHQQRMAVIENMHKSVVVGLECIQNNTAKILQDQERDLMRAFRARLQEVSKDLESQRSRKGEHSTELQARHSRVVAELQEAQELAQTFDKKNQQLTAENQRLQEKLRTREDDRQALLRELVMSRKEVARLKAQSKEGVAGDQTPEGHSLEHTLPKLGRTITHKQVDQARLQECHNKQYNREVAARDAVQKLKRMVEVERRTIRALKHQQADFLQQRSELEVLLRQCLDDVKAEILRHRVEIERKEVIGGGLPNPGPPVNSMSINELSAQDRERILELLLSQQRVVQLLYSKTFTGPAPVPMADSGFAGDAGHEDDFSWLSDIIPPEVT